MLRVENGELKVTYNGSGTRVSEQVSIPPMAGKDVFTTLDLALQRRCESALAVGTKRGVMVVIDPHTGDILAMASWPPLDPNQFVPSISEADYDALKTDKNEPLSPGIRRHRIRRARPSSVLWASQGWPPASFLPTTSSSVVRASRLETESSIIGKRKTRAT